MNEQHLSDEELMLLYKQGDQVAFEKLYIRYKDTLYRYFIKNCNDKDYSEEMYQDVWIKLINSAPRYKPSAKFVTYMFTIAHNTLIDFYRKKKVTVSIDEDNTNKSDEILENYGPISLPEDEFTLIQKSKKLMHALQYLSEAQKETIILHLEKELGVKEIAKITNVKFETAKSRLRYAKNKLKAAILN